MKIVCLVKQVPHPEAIQFDPETKTLRREGVPLELNPFDRAAVRRAVVLRDAAGGEVVAMTMGPPAADAALRETLALGADRAVHLSDRTFAVADTIGTSRTLALAIEKEGADLVLCGRKTVDSETWQVPPQVAARLDWPVLTGVTELAAHGSVLHAVREADDGEEAFVLDLPAVVSVARADGGDVTPAEAPARPTLWTAADLVPDARPHDRRFGQAGSPTRVLAVRDVTPARAGALAAGPEDAAARIVGLLDERRPAEASWDKPGHIADRPGASYDCWTVVELVDGRPHRTSLELLARGRQLAGKLGGVNVALMLGHGLTEVARELARRGAERIVLLDDPAYAEYRPDVWTAAVREVVERNRPHVLLLPATAAGREYGPRVAGELELGMTADCVGVDVVKAGRLLQTKPAYGGNIVSVIMSATTPQLATVRPRMYEPLEPRDGVEAEIVHLSVAAAPDPRLRQVERRRDSPAHGLDVADVVTVIGAGAGPDAAVRIEPVARAAGAAVGGTREACAAGWIPWNRHVGLHGRAVAPRLLVAVGVGGDFEHLTGFVKAGVVFAIDTEPDAPMLRAADVGLVGDWRTHLLPVHERVAPHL
ncbi:MAG: FAD-binding protein [Gaiellaceae bacterium]